MAPFSLMTAGVSLLAKSFSVFSCTSALTRSTSVLPATHISLVKCLTSQASAPPKRPLNAYMRFFQQQHSVMTRQNPEIKSVDVMRKVGQQWRTLTPEQKRPFQDAALKAWDQFKVDIEHYQARLTPAQVQQQALEKRQRQDKRKAIRKKRELNNLGKPKRPRSALNIFISEHFEEARGTTTPAKMKSLTEDWRNLFSHQKQVYTQLAQDDKVRYKNEMTSWEDHMLEIGREDLIREQTLTTKRKIAPQTLAAKKTAKRAKAKTAKKTTARAKKATAKKTTATGKSKTTKKTV